MDATLNAANKVTGTDIFQPTNISLEQKTPN
jgi:hypothetical protein